MNSRVLIASAIGFTALTLWLTAQVPKKVRVLEKSSVLRILDELYLSLKPCCLRIAKYANAIKSNSPTPPTSIQLYQFLDNDFSISDLINSHKAPVYSSWDISDSELEACIQSSFQLDKEVQESYSKILNHIKNACNGFILEETSHVPFELTSQLGLEILSEVYYCELYFVYLKRTAKVNDVEEMEDWEIDSDFSDQETSCKLKVFAKFGFKIEEKKVNATIRQTIRNFGILDEDFKNAHRKLEERYNLSLDKLATSTSEQDLERFLKEKYKYYTNLQIE